MRRLLVFSLCCLGLLTFSMGSSAVAVAFPVMTTDLKTNLILSGWVLTISQLVVTVTMPIGGKLSDILGRKLMFIISLLFYLFGSLGCALSPDIGLLIFSRFLQGIGGGTMLPSVTGILVEEFPKSRQRVIGLLSSFFSVGAVIGPNVGGWLVETFDWRAVFWFNVPVALIVLLPSLYIIRASPPEGGKLDMVGAGFFTAALSAFLMGITSFGGPGSGISLEFGIVLLIAAAAFLAVFIWYERRIPNPIIDLQIFRERPFLSANFFNLGIGFSVVGITSFIPLYAVSLFGMSTLASGVVLTPRSVASILGSVVVSIFLVKWGYRKPMIIGTVLMIASMIIIAMEPTGNSLLGVPVNSVALLAALIFIGGLGQGIIMPAANNACIELMPERVATITGIRGMFRYMGGAICINMVTVILNLTGDMAKGFAIVFFAISALSLISIPAIFLMPSSCLPATQAKRSEL
jgi:EmrB/QacA subfamily drug resistance transporter